MWINTESIVRDLFNLAPYGKMWIRRQKNRQEPQKTAKIKYVLQFFIQQATVSVDFQPLK